MSVSVVTCPYCGLPKWKRVEKVLSNTKKFLIVSICQCENCGKMFYLCRTKICTFTVKLEEVSKDELLGETQSKETQRRRSRRRGGRRSRQSARQSQKQREAEAKGVNVSEREQKENCQN